ncbi:putative transporter [Cercospora beticola]|nr:putative transporter [Cercospora beticola]PIA93844.1 putative transporter [Cercospora beticola]
MTEKQPSRAKPSSSVDEAESPAHNDPNEESRPARDWSHGKKLRTTFLVGCLRFVSSLAASSPSFALPIIASEFGTVGNRQLTALPLSAFLLGYIFGPLLIAPLSSTFGRVRVLQCSCLVFVIFNTAAGVANTNWSLSVFRFLSGFGGSGPVTLGIGILTDCWTADERTRMIPVYTLPVQLGPAVAPIVGAFITKHLTWRWSFFCISIASTIVQVVGVIFLRETHVPLMSSDTSGAEKKILLAAVNEAFQRPMRIFTLHATTQLLALYAAVTYAIVYMSFVSFEDVWGHGYGQRSDLASLNFIAIAVGEIGGSLGVRPFNVWLYRKLTMQSDRVDLARPEYRTPALVFGALLLPAGLLLFGWSAQSRLFPVVPDLGVALYAAGEVIVLQFTSLYIADVYEQRATDAMAGVYILRCLVGFGLSIVTPSMFHRLGYGFGNTLLAGIAVVIGWPLPWMIWAYGAKLRQRDQIHT